MPHTNCGQNGQAGNLLGRYKAVRHLEVEKFKYLWRSAVKAGWFSDFQGW